MPSTTVDVDTVPPCDFDPDHGPAFADAMISAARGSWAYVCRSCFDIYGCSLGLRRGQELIARKDRATR